MDSTSSRIAPPTFFQRLEATPLVTHIFYLRDKIKQVALFIFEQLAYVYRWVTSSLRTLFTYSIGRANREAVQQVLPTPSHQIKAIPEAVKSLRETPVGSVHDEIMAYIFALAGDVSQIKAVCKEWQGITETHSYLLFRLRRCESIIGKKQANCLYEEMGQVESFCSKQRYRILVQDQIRQIESLLIDDEAKDFFQQFPITQEVASFQQRQQWICDCNLIIMASQTKEEPLRGKAYFILTQFKQGHFDIQQVAEEIRQCIKEGSLQTCTKLLLYNQWRSLTQLTPEIKHLTNLSMFAVTDTPVRELPQDITCFTNLTELNISHTQIRELPQDITCLTNLTKLNISHTQIRELPQEISDLTDLRDLYINSTQIRKLPKGISRLTNLRVLQIDYTQIRELSQDISRLTNLEELNIICTQIEGSTQEILFHMFGILKKVYINHNQISELPEEIRRLTNLKIYISYIEISKLPEEIRRLLPLSSN